MAEVAELEDHDAGAGSARQKKLGDELDKELAQIPNLPLDDVPDGKDESTAMSSIISSARSAITPSSPSSISNWAKRSGMMDFELAAKLSGARFVVLQKGLARMERALGQFMLDLHTGEKHGYTEVNPPLLVRDEAMFGTAQLPKFAEDQFHLLHAMKFCEAHDQETMKQLANRFWTLPSTKGLKRRVKRLQDTSIG